jgi:HTH-type transcriptional regulator/antitoxin HigA
MIQIKTEAEYRAALKEIESLMIADADKTPAEGEKLATMVTLIEAYEAKHFPMEPDNL